MKIHVGNLPFSINSDGLRELFSSFGEIEDAVVISNKFSGRSKGFGFVTFLKDEDAKKAIEEMNEKKVEGRILRVNEARPIEDTHTKERRSYRKKRF